MGDLEDRLAKARARCEAAEAAINPPPSVEDELAAIEAEADAAEALAAAIAEHGKDNVAYADTRLGRVIVKRPHIAAFKKFTDSDRVTNDVVEALVRPCVVGDKARADRIFNELPAVVWELGMRLQELAGARKDATAKK